MARMNDYNHKCSECRKNGTEACPIYVKDCKVVDWNIACDFFEIKSGLETISAPKRLNNFVKFTNTKDTIFYIKKDLITELTDKKIKDDLYEYQIWWQEGNKRRYEDISLEEYERLVEEVVD